MSDDLTGPPAGENPPAGPPAPPPPPGSYQPPVFVHEGGTAPAPVPATGRSEPPRRSSGADNWPWYYALWAFFGGFVASQIVIVFILIGWEAAGGDAENDAAYTVVASAANEVMFVVAAYFVARMSGGVSWRDFGLLKAPFWSTVGKMAAIMASYFVLLAIYTQAVNLAPDDAPDELGAGSGWIGMLAFALLVAVLAPIAEEVFFRGMVFRAFSNGIGVIAAAIVSGLLFGAMHINSTDSERLLQVVPLAILGVFFALLYAWSGTLYAPIALHATNNALAVAVFADKNDSTFGLILAGVIWTLMMIGCAIGWRWTDRAGDEPPAVDQGPPLVAPERPDPVPWRPS